eukprot:CAMPEP_0113624600 /NCGR_PEP_ID=MMETSP0017_2-20120614/12686_1 /TAXON_ID=2856 /ORGANISM="Cylindrotheca closterium" /LENGTH=261 /DNA_ID=CAMNT_0000534645 /DNA_START=69 /DNA_END=850 /DNA_ORIENTATION=+ /assembly_acc=CAM_ASM_000147
MNMTQQMEKVDACLSPYASCVEAEIQAILNSLPTCLNSTVVNLGQCFVDNGATCNTTCTKDDIPETNPYATVDASTLVTCNAFQTDIMDPTCTIVDCCQPCVDELEAAMNCITQNGLDLKQAPPNANDDCALSCTAASTRGRQLELTGRMLAGHVGGGIPDIPKLDKMFSPETILADCGIYFETADGLNGLRAGIEELRTRIVEGEFFQCLFESLFALADQGAKESMANVPAPTAAPGTTPTDTAGAVQLSMTTMMVVSVV